MHAVTVATVYNRLKEWLLDQSNTGDYVTDVSLDLLNRANQELWGMDWWEGLMLRETLTLSSNVATLASDYGKTYCVFEDVDSDGKPDKYWYRNGSPSDGYRVERTYTVAAGKTFKFRFYQSPSVDPTHLYQRRIDDFTAANASGATTGYIFWPEELLLLMAQIIHKRDADDTGDGNYDRIVVDFKRNLREFKRWEQFANNDFVLEQNDANGIRMYNPSYDLLGGDSLGSPIHDNSMDGGLN